MVLLMIILHCSLYGLAWAAAWDTNFTIHLAYDQLLAEVDEITKSFPNITMKQVIGKSTTKKDIVAVKIGWNVQQGRPLLRPMVKIVANMHGDERMGLEMMVVLIR